MQHQKDVIISKVDTGISCKEKCHSFEAFMGEINGDGGMFGYERAVMDDEVSRYPQEAIDALNLWGLNKHYIPKEYGGDLVSYYELFWLMRLLSRRDLTVAIAHGKTYLGAVTVWIAGNEEQKLDVAKIIMGRGLISLAITELGHGSDLLSSDVVLRRIDSGYVLSGSKWLINNGTYGQALTVFAKSHDGDDGRGCSMILLDKKNMDPKFYHYHEKIKTHGIKGADISGIQFDNVRIEANSVLGAEGKGLEIILKGLQITRTMCSALSLGAVDTCLRTTLNFAINRKLYGTTVYNLDHAKRELIKCYVLNLGMEACSMMGSRALHVLPEQMSLYSSIIKYIIPSESVKIINDLSVILGARYYLREAHDHGIFQKMMRDNELVGLFDGSTVVNLHAICIQLKMIANVKKKFQHEAYNENVLFNVDMELPAVNVDKLRLSTRGRDNISSLVYLSKIDLFADIDENNALVAILRKQINSLKKKYKDTLVAVRLLPIPGKHLSVEYAELSKSYSQLFLAATSILFWINNISKIEKSFVRGEWLVLLLHQVIQSLNANEVAINSEVYEKVGVILSDNYHSGDLFSLFRNQYQSEAGDR
jgi:alkylation response protein AidB-like acyl-CoA dehydrogenase